MKIWCEDCDNLEASSRKREWFRFRCLKAPKAVPNQCQVREPFLIDSPFKLCKQINTNFECEMFEPRKEANA